MRNLFDQYDQPENRITHALISALAAEPKLLKRFVLWVTGKPLPAGRLEILEQSLPGQLTELSEDESERKGLPDACMAGADGWALVIESKFAATVSTNQVQRHLRTAERRGLRGCQLLLLTTSVAAGNLPERVISRTWTEIYQWLIREARDSDWASIAAQYLEVAEARGSASGYFTEGTLTVFAGIPFDDDNPYTYTEAKRILGVLRKELLKDRRLHQELGADPASRGRPAITGRSARHVWDFIGLRTERPGPFTRVPHLTLGISEIELGVTVTLPDGMPGSRRAQVFGPDFGSFDQLIQEVTETLTRVLTKCPHAAPRINVFQRHYPSQRSTPFMDSRLEFDPRTALPGGFARGRVKAQPQWLRATYDAITSRRSNLQFQIGAVFPYATCPQVRSPEIRDLAARVWLACRPIIAAATRERTHPPREGSKKKRTRG